MSYMYVTADTCCGAMLLYQNLAGVVEAGFMKILPFVAAIEAETVGLSPVVSFDSVIKNNEHSYIRTS